MEAEAGGGAGLGEDRAVAQMGGERVCELKRGSTL